MLKKETKNSMDYQNRYYTNDSIAKFLVNRFTLENAQTVLDIGVGHGNLLFAAFQRWKNARFFCADVDKSALRTVQKKLPNVNSIQGNGLSNSLVKKWGIKFGTIDIAVCNPPYSRIVGTTQIRTALREAGFLNSAKHLKVITSDILFLIRNIMMLRDGGEIGIILPDGILTGKEFLPFREDILTSHTITSIIQLPENTFKKTEARTHILYIKKGISKIKTVSIYKPSQISMLGKPLKVNPIKLIKRMDYNYHEWNIKNANLKNNLTLKDIGANIKRGTKSFKELRNSGSPYIHTNELPTHPEKIELQTCDIPSKLIFAESNDILLSRVGKRCIARLAFIRKGRCPISDCLYKIKVPQQYTQLVWKSLSSKEGREWLNAHKHGVCAQVISKSDLLEFPLLAQSPTQGPP